MYIKKHYWLKILMIGICYDLNSFYKFYHDFTNNFKLLVFVKKMLFVDSYRKDTYRVFDNFSDKVILTNL